ncbi:polycystin-1-like protein 2 [Saccostrea cucullata]|uniref:polycystin-1-like protein 2 n=1 Tax=Saccostrea cuccullata TaxID=36930 RepID=UPI002ED382C9
MESIKIDTSGGGPVFLVYQQKTVKLLQLIKSVVAPGCANSIDRFKLTDIQQIFSTLDALTRFKPYLSLEGVNITVDIVHTVIDCLEYGSRRNPVSPSAVESLIDIAKVYHRVLDNVLNKMLPRKLQNLDVELSEDDIRAEIMLHLKFFLQETSLLKQNQGNVTLDFQSINRQVDFIYQIRAHERQFQLQQRQTARKYIPIIKRIQSVFVNVMHKTIVLGERLYWNANHVLEIMIRKVSFNDLEDAPDEFFGGVHDVNGSNNQASYLELAVSNYLRNPYIYGENATKATSSVPVMNIPQNISVDTNIPNKGNLEFKRYIPLINPQYSEPMIYFTFEVINKRDAVLIYIKPDGFDFLGHQKVPLYSFYFSSDTFPTSNVFDYKKVLGVEDWTGYGFKVFLPGGICVKELCYLGIKPLTAPDTDDFARSRKKRAAEFLTTIGPPDNTTSIVNASDFVPAEANFSMLFTTTGCRTWEKGNNSWTMEGCLVLPMSDLNNTVCRCVGDTISTSFYVPPNMINFLTVWGKFDASNAAVYGILAVVFVIYIILLIVLRRKDKKDSHRRVVTFLCDHDTRHTYFYLISVYTGFRRGAGTKSNVYFILTGDVSDSGIRPLHDGIQEGFSTSSVNMYFFGTNEPLGDLRYIRIWHDNSGPRGFKSWFLSKITVDDLEKQERYVFHCNKLLGIDDEDCLLDRIIPVSTQDTISFNDRISVETQSLMSVYHLWLSLLFRPQGNFTRVQRLSCLFALICLIMISNAMFFRSSDENQNVDEVKFGILRLSFRTFYVSCVGMLISTVPVTFAAFVFRNTRNPKSTESRIDNPKRNSFYPLRNETYKSFSKLDGEVFMPHQGTLPRWVCYIAWISVLLAILSSSFFLILYSMEWGKANSEEWLLSLALSFLESFIVFDPVKVIFFAIVYSTFLKRLAREEPPKVNLDKLRLMSKDNGFCKDSRISDLATNISPRCGTFSKEDIDDLKKKSREESQARSALISLVMFILYICAIYGIGFTQRDQRSLNVKQNLDNYLLSGSRGFSALKGRKDFIRWMNDTFIPTYYPTESYAGEPLTVMDRQWLKDMVNIRVGPGRLRQVRMKTGKCPYFSLTWPYPCVDAYSERDEDKSSYCLRWKPYNDTICGSELYKKRFYTAQAWKYVHANEIWGISRMGEYKTYGGGGYILQFVKDRVNAHLLLNELVENNWIDRNTRAIFVEFTIYNSNVNLFAYVMYIMEFTEVGSAFIWTDTQAFKPILSLSSLGFTLVLFYMIVFFYYIILLFKILLQCRRVGCLGFVKEPWNCVDCLCTILAYSCLLTFILRMKYTNTAMDMFYDDKLTGANRFINYGHIVLWDHAFNVLFATLLFISTIQVLRILGYNKRFTEVISVISNVGKDLLAFGALLLILFVSFVIYAYLLFGSKLESYRSMYNTCASLANTLIGKNKLDPLIMAAPLSAQFFYVCYVLCVIMFMLTVFMAILNTSISAVRVESVASAAKIGILDIMKKFVRNTLEVFFRPKKSKKLLREEQKTSDDIDAAIVMRLVRDIVYTFENKETKLVDKKILCRKDRRNLPVQPPL